MSDKQAMIKKMLEMQKKFTEYEQQNGVDPKDYWKAPEGHPLHGYREEYNKLAMQLVDVSHADKGSHR
jgi:soluble cytochrome b562